MNQTHYVFSKLLQAITIYRIINFPDNNGEIVLNWALKLLSMLAVFNLQRASMSPHALYRYIAIHCPLCYMHCTNV